ncbi:hypothetical protein ACHAWO_007928 [Cyclotella atomus]|uniref:Uncharacterized protein n=1 Tax=Cyclotella atomus TaxID=382360 RepID=A0ABD3MQQ4_9STRA
MSGRRFRGGGGGRSSNARRPPSGRGGGSATSTRNTTTSPLHLPHVKVTIRNIQSVEHFDTKQAVLHAVQHFLIDAFTINDDASHTHGGGQETAYNRAVQLEKLNFETNKSLLESKSALLGWTYNEPNNIINNNELPSPESIVESVYQSSTTTSSASNTNTTVNKNIQTTIDTAMSTMMNECGKLYLHRVGGKCVVDGESCIVAVLNERIDGEKKKTGVASAEGAASEGGEDAKGGDATKGSNKEEDSVEQLTQNMENLSTTSKTLPSKTTEAEAMEATRIRILSVTPVKKSKRRGDIGARVELVLYPPDPCLMFKELCREAGRVAVERFKDSSSNTTGAEAAGGEDTPQSTQQSPTIPNFPRLSPAERSRAIARSRVLMDRTISAMKIHAASSQSSNNQSYASWEIFESSSQKTWKSPSYDIVQSILNGASLTDLLDEEEKKVTLRRGGGAAKNARSDRYDSTIENSEDYKSFMELYTDNGSKSAPPPPAAATDKKDEPLDEEGRPLSAIVQHLQSKRAEEAKVKADAKAAASRARAKAAAEAARTKARKRELEKKTNKAKDRMRREEERRKKKISGGGGGKMNSSRSGNSGGGGGGAPPPGAVLLKKGDVPASGFGSK